MIHSHRLPDESHESFCAPFTLDGILNGLSRSPNFSSPGTDSLPYQIVRLVFNHPATAAIGLRVFNDALLRGIYPPSWTQTSLVLLPKKGDLSLLKNWRPISLINTDAKTFTRLINARLMIHFSDNISIQQMGFMPGRFIAEQGLQLQCMQAIATKSNLPSIALLLDQEKAYDRIHVSYLDAILQAFNIPRSLITAILNLFSSTMIQPNVNGFLSTPLPQLRGLRQGDPLSPLLFNIAFDPFLRAVNNDNRIQGFTFPSDPLSSSPPSPIKALAYADDTLVTLNNPTEFSALQHLLQRYMAAFNALLNYNKTQALSLSGKPHPHWTQFLASKGIHSWHDNTSPSPLRYLGYGIFSNPQRRAAFADTLISSIRSTYQLHFSRNLTIRGRVTVSNSLTLSKLWHALRLVTFLPSELDTIIQSIISSFVNQNAKITRFSFDTLTLPRSMGGLKLLNPAQQDNALQWRWLQPLLHPDQPSSPLMPSLPVPRSTLSFYLGSSRFPSYHWSLLFPPCRPTGLPSTGPVSNTTVASIFQISILQDRKKPISSTCALGTWTMCSLTLHKSKLRGGSVPNKPCLGPTVMLPKVVRSTWYFEKFGSKTEWNKASYSVLVCTAGCSNVRRFEWYQEVHRLIRRVSRTTRSKLGHCHSDWTKGF